MKQLPSTDDPITFYVPEEMLEWIDDMISKGKYANRTEVIIEAIASLYAADKLEQRAFPKKKTPFKVYVKEIKESLRRDIF